MCCSFKFLNIYCQNSSPSKKQSKYFFSKKWYEFCYLIIFFVTLSLLPFPYLLTHTATKTTYCLNEAAIYFFSNTPLLDLKTLLHYFINEATEVLRNLSNSVMWSHFM